MSKRRFSFIPVLAIALTLILGSSAGVFAESYDYSKDDFHCYFENNHKMNTNYSAKVIAEKVNRLQPGDDMTFVVTYKNKSKEKTTWYLENAIAKTLEDVREQSLAVSGIGEAENAGYKYEISNNGDVLFNSKDKVIGGEKEVAGREGLKQGTNALEDWINIGELAPGEGGKVTLKIALEGETEVNDYMDTDGEVNLRFAVELPKKGNNPPVKTGDYNNITRWVAILMAASVLLLIFAIISVRRDRKETYNAKH